MKDAWYVALKRRAAPLKLPGNSETLNFDSVNGLKLTQNEMVLTFKKSSPEREVLYLLATLCKLDDRVFVSDAVVLSPSESADEFLQNNLKFVVSYDENVDYARCLRPGDATSSSQSGGGGILWEDRRRAATFLNHWTNFFAVYRKKNQKAVAFFNMAIVLQLHELKEIMNINKASDMQTLISYLDYSDPLALIKETRSVAGVDVKTLMQYLETIIYMRSKLLGFYPDHEEKLKYERQLLKALEKK